MSTKATKDRVFELTNNLTTEVSILLGLASILEATIDNFSASGLTMFDLAILAGQIKRNADNLIDKAEEVFDMGQEYVKVAV